MSLRDRVLWLGNGLIAGGCAVYIGLLWCKAAAAKIAGVLHV